MSERPPGTVLTYGTFDLFHHGHVRLLRRLALLGDRLIVGCSTDEFNLVKGKTSVVPYEYRVEVLLSCRWVDQVIPEDNWDQKKTDIQHHNVDIFGMGSDWTGKFDDLRNLCKVVYLDRTDNVSSTGLKERATRLNKTDWAGA